MAKTTRRARRDSAESPTSDCLLLCRDVLRSYGGGQYSLHGVLSKLVVENVPTVLGPSVVYFRMSNVYESQKITLRIRHCDSDPTDEPILKLEVQSPKGSNPLGLHTLIIPLPRFVIERDGRHVLEATHGRDDIAFVVSPFFVTARKPEADDE